MKIIMGVFLLLAWLVWGLAIFGDFVFDGKYLTLFLASAFIWIFGHEIFGKHDD